MIVCVGELGSGCGWSADRGDIIERCIIYAVYQLVVVDLVIIANFICIVIIVNVFKSFEYDLIVV